MTSGDTYQLIKLVQIYTQMENKLRGRNTFVENFKENNICGVFKNRVFSLIEDYKIIGNELNRLIGVINITKPNSHYVQF